jgi:hypothetical protein
MEALDTILGYLFETEEEDYEQRKEEGDCVQGHVYEHCLTLDKVFGPRK